MSAKGGGKGDKAQDPTARVVDGRMPPFCWQDKKALRLIRKSFKTSEIATALAIYLTLTEMASNHQAEEFQVKRATIGRWVGRSSVRSVDHYLERLAEIGVIEKEPLARANEFKCMTIRLVSTPDEPQGSGLEDEGTQGVGAGEGVVVQPTAPPHEGAVQPAAPPGATHRTTLCSPLPIEIEESSSPEKNLPSKHTGPEGRDGEPSEESGEARTPQRARGKSAPAAGQTTANGVQTMMGPAGAVYEPRRKVESGLAVDNPGERDDEPRRKPRKLPPAHPDKPVAEWKTPDMLQYFAYRWKEKWPTEPVPVASKQQMSGVKGRLAWLDTEEMPRATMKRAIDHLFDGWGQNLRDALKYKESRPTPYIIATTWMFERLLRDADVGLVASDADERVTHDSYNEAAAKKARESADGWGD